MVLISNSKSRKAGGSGASRSGGPKVPSAGGWTLADSLGGLRVVGDVDMAKVPVEPSPGEGDYPPVCEDPGPLGPWWPPRVEEFVIGPDAARELLDHHNWGNRTARRVNQKRIDEALRRGAYRRNGQALIYDWTGNGLNGAHRLRASVHTGMPLRTLVVFGVAPDVYTTIDAGAAKTAYDALRHRGEKYAIDVAAAVRVLLKYLSGVRSADVFEGDASTLEIFEWIDRNPRIRVHVAAAKSSLMSRFVTTRILTVARFLFQSADPDLGAGFFERLDTGANMAADDPVLKLRNLLMGSRNDKVLAVNDRLRAALILDAMIRVWNAERAGRRLRTVKFAKVGKGGAFQLPEVR